MNEYQVMLYNGEKHNVRASNFVVYRADGYIKFYDMDGDDEVIIAYYDATRVVGVNTLFTHNRHYDKTDLYQALYSDYYNRLDDDDGSIRIKDKKELASVIDDVLVFIDLERARKIRGF